VLAAPLAIEAAPLTVSVRTEAAFEGAVSAFRESGGTIVLLPHAYRELVVWARSPRPLRIVGASGVRVERVLFDHTQHVALARLGKETRSASSGDRLIGADVRWETVVECSGLPIYWLLRRLVGLLARGVDGQRELELVVLRYQIKLLSRQESRDFNSGRGTGRSWPRRRCFSLGSDAPACWSARTRCAAGIGSSFAGHRRALRESQADHRSPGRPLRWSYGWGARTRAGATCGSAAS
jgi:hypothetical protein